MRSLLLVLLLPALLPAQNTSCALSGAVQDAVGAVIPNIKVTLTGEENGFVRTVTTTSEGFFSFPDLTPATFTITVAAPGFKTYRQTGIIVNAAEQASVGQIKLELGQVSESVTVAAAAVAINLSTGERSGTLGSEELDQIALRGRDIFDAVSLLPGVIDTGDGRDAPSPNSIANIFIMGGRNDQKNMTVDGVTNLDTGSNGTVHSMPSMDSVAEVRVLMSAYSAENGRNPSSINVITRGGGRDLHGRAAWYFRNEDLNANDFFANEAGRPRTEYRYNIASYTLGGPVILPKVNFNRKRDKMFFFFSQEFQQQVVPYGVMETTMPSALERQGNFTQSKNANGTVIKVNDPLNSKVQFPGNIVPVSRINPVGQAILNMFPLPNFVDPNPAYTYQWNYYAQSAQPYPRRTETGRVDYALRDNWQMYASLSNNADKQNVPYKGGTAGWAAGSLNFPLAPIHFEQPGRLATLHSINTLSPAMFNETAVAFSQNTLTFTPLNTDAVNRSLLGIDIPQRNPALNPLNLIPDMSFSGIQNYANPSMNDGTPYFNQNTIYSLIDNVSKVSGTHTFKMGLYYEHTQKIQSASPLIRGSLSFNTDGNNALDSNNAYSNALLGNYDSYGEATARPQGRYIFTNMEWFFQDTWRAKRNLSLDYGVRFYHDTPQYDARRQLASFSIGAYNPANAVVLLRPATVNGVKVALDPTTGNTYPSGLIGDFAPGIGNTANGEIIGGKNGVPSGMFTTSPINVAPRFGFAWDPTGHARSALRGGGGVYFDRIQGNPVMNLINNPPTIYTPTQYYGTFADIAASAGSGFLSPSGTVYSLAGKGRQQIVYNFNLSIDRQIGNSTTVQVAYAGALGRHLLWERNINAVPLGANFLNLNPQDRDLTTTSSVLPTNFLRPYQGLGDVFLYEFANNSNYHSATAGFRHRLSRGVNVSSFYTFSKALDCSDAYSQAVDPFLATRSRNYGPANYDRRQVFSANFFWSLPKPGKHFGIRPLGWIADNWQVSGVVRMMTGGPFTPGYSGNPSPSSTGYTLVNGITGPSGSPSVGPRPEVINPAAPLNQRFAPAFEPAGQSKVLWSVASTAPQLGNLGKNTETGPGTNNCDLSIYKDFRIRERITSQLRLETYNTFNHTQFSSYDTTLRFDSNANQVNTAFGLPSAARPPRRVLIALRLTF